MPDVGREERIEVTPGRISLDEAKLASEELHCEQREYVHEHHPDESERSEGPERDSESVQDLAHALPRSREFEEPEQAHPPQRRDPRPRGVAVVEGLDNDFDDARHDDEAVELVELVAEVAGQPQPQPLKHHLGDEHHRQDRVHHREVPVPRRIEVGALPQGVPTYVPQTQRATSSFVLHILSHKRPAVVQPQLARPARHAPEPVAGHAVCRRRRVALVIISDPRTRDVSWPYLSVVLQETKLLLLRTVPAALSIKGEAAVEQRPDAVV
mmetsp:Transcript_57868/g.135888  ORF Transcript_57868/g.135888 Transcript_57868/m.135888 type:complete len:269 (-) Transcript_57868:1069-1875(-)